jgi:hypothetical protein
MMLLICTFASVSSLAGIPILCWHPLPLPLLLLAFSLLLALSVHDLTIAGKPLLFESILLLASLSLIAFLLLLLDTIPFSGK